MTRRKRSTEVAMPDGLIDRWGRRRSRGGPSWAQAYLVTLFAFRQRVQTYTRRGRPASSIRTFWRFGSKRRLVATIEWLRELPNAGPLPQLWQTLAMARASVATARRGYAPLHRDGCHSPQTRSSAPLPGTSSRR